MHLKHVGPGIMAEVNERLARVETKVDNQGDLLERLDRHMETMSASQAEMAKTVAQIPGLFHQMLDIQRETGSQGNRITALEREMAQSRQARDHLREVLEPKVNRSHFVASTTAWVAGVLLAALITAVTKGWIE